MVTDKSRTSILRLYQRFFFIPRVEHVFIPFPDNYRLLFCFTYGRFPYLSLFSFGLLTDGLLNDFSYFGLFFLGCSKIIESFESVVNHSMAGRRKKKKLKSTLSATDEVDTMWPDLCQNHDNGAKENIKLLLIIFNILANKNHVCAGD